MRKSCVLAAVAGLSLTAGTAYAQPADQITVTGQRLPETLSDTPLAVSVVSGEEVADLAPQHVSEVLNLQPGVFLHRGSGAEHLTAIRSPVLTGGAGAGSFLYLEDGVPMRAAGFSNVNGLFEGVTGHMGGLEVVRGPGSALYGSNALHGMINILTPDPASTPDVFEAEIGSFGRYRGRIGLTGETQGAARFAGLEGGHEDGWREEAGLDRVTGLIRADGSTGRVDWRFTASAFTLNQETAGFIFGTDAYRDRAASRANNDPEAFRDAWAFRTALRADIALDNGTTLSLTPYARSNEMDFLMHFLPSEALEESGHDSFGLLASWRGGSEAFDWTIGADVERTSGYLTETQERPTIFSFVQGVHYDYEVEADVAALYAQGEWRVSETLSLRAGARYEATSYRYDNLGPSDTVGRFLRLPDREDEFDTFTPSLSFVWRTDEAGRLFGRIARGARAPQTAELYRLQPSQDIAGIEPETLDSIELGYRRALTNEGRLELVGFSMRKENVFFRDADGFNVTDGKTDHQGIEFDLHQPLTDQWAVGASGTWAEHTYAFDRNVARSSDVIVDGAEVDTAPNWLWSARAVWTPNDRVRARLDWVHVGEYFTNAANSASYGGHDLLNLRVDAELKPGFELFMAVRNLTDERYATRADFAFGNDRYFPGEEANASIGVRVTR
jgi:outer membrane receptor protein involved in Fe transport